jgi:hypothetical protein
LQKFSSAYFDLLFVAYHVLAADCIRESEKFAFMRKSPLRGIVAALDGIAVAIRRPSLAEVPDPVKYFNRKEFYSLCVQAAVSADYRVLFVSAMHAGSTHDSTAYQSTSLHRLLQISECEGGLSDWACVAADDAYGNRGRILTPYGGRGFTRTEDTFYFFLSSCRITVEQTFGIIINRFGVLWTALRCSVMKSTLTIIVCCKLHNFIMDSENHQWATKILSDDPDNHISGRPVVYLQDELHKDVERVRGRHIDREITDLRQNIAEALTELGYKRPAVVQV